MDRQRWEEIQAAFDELAELNAAERVGQLAAIGTTDPELRSAIESLLVADAEADERLAPIEAALLASGDAKQLQRLTSALAHRYSIEREIGSGGMATVYLASDLKHHRQVAVKVLKPELAAVLGPGRFLREVEITAGLRHPHILPLYDSGEAEGLVYYVMPYVEGESLREKCVREVELPVTEAARLLRDIVEALAHAHKRGLVHRDIKPENVMVSEHHALVMDFGIAKAVSEAAGRERPTTVGVTLGTPTYMAPEQASADPHIDHRADIYAVGVVGYELLAGRPPFIGSTPQEVLAAHMAETPEPLTHHRPAVPPALATLVMKCLAKRPADRWQTAEELLPQLEAFATPRGGVTPTDRKPLSITARTRRRLLTRAGVAAGVIVVASLGAWAMLNGGRSDLVRNRVVVAPFINRTGDDALDHLGPMAAEWIQRGLFETAVLQVIGTPPSVPSDSAVALQSFAKDAGARLVVTGTYYELRDSLHFEAQITESATGQLIGLLEPVAAATDDPTVAIETLRQRIMSALAWVTDPSIDSLARITTRPPSYPAARELMEAREAQGRGDWRSAMNHARSALRLDSTYVSALTWLAAGHLNLREFIEADSVLRILERYRDNLPEIDRYIVDWTRALVDGDPRAALRASERQAQRNPTSTVLQQVAADNMWLNRPRAALAVLNDLDPERPGVGVGFWDLLSRAHHHLEHYKEALRAAREGLRRHPNHGLLLGLEMINLAALRAVDEIHERLDEITAQRVERGPNAGWIMVSAGLELKRHGHIAEGQQLLSRAITWYEENLSLEELASNAGDLWSALWGAGRFEETAELVRRVGPESFSRNAVDTLGALGLLAAARGDTAGALRLSDQLEVVDDPRYSILVEQGRLQWQAAIAAHLSDLEGAVRILRRWHERDGVTGWTHVNPLFAPLHGYPPYEELVRPKG
jgi:tetratricopeptide (TPR) repeat protein